MAERAVGRVARARLDEPLMLVHKRQNIAERWSLARLVFCWASHTDARRFTTEQVVLSDEILEPLGLAV